MTITLTDTNSWEVIGRCGIHEAVTIAWCEGLDEKETYTQLRNGESVEIRSRSIRMEG